jgi:hypothetical protein
MVTMRSSSSEVSSPALHYHVNLVPMEHDMDRDFPYRLLRSTSAFLQTRLEYLRPTPLIFVKAYMTFCFPSSYVNIRSPVW